ncbi:MAG TPA: CsgG/HfaB family protein [Candidatus Methylomirabilis sp.]|nr:CsgG/HfaB family protein [Candidatus Methylomirabilis sp.]
MSRFVRFLCISILATIPCAAQQVAPPSAQPTAAAPAAPKKRVAVMNFDYGTVKTVVASIFGTDQDVGKGITDLMVQKLVQDGKFSVIERAALDKIIAEQNFSNSDRADPTSAAKIGRVLGVDTIILGSITKFGRDDKKVGGVGGGHSGWTGAIAGIGKKESKAEVSITARMVNTTTGEILAAVTGNGESSRSGLMLGGGGGTGYSGGGGAFDMSSSNFAETILGEAVNKAVADAATQLDDKAATLPVYKATYSGLIADVSGNTIIINVGNKVGVRVGDVIQVSRPVRTVKDPTTGKVLKVVTNELGKATVTEVDADSATATYNGTTPLKVGDVAASTP